MHCRRRSPRYAALAYAAKEEKPLGEKLSLALDKAARGGIAGGGAMAINVGALMWMRTTVNYQYRHCSRTLARPSRPICCCQAVRAYESSLPGAPRPHRLNFRAILHSTAPARLHFSCNLELERRALAT